MLFCSCLQAPEIVVNLLGFAGDGKGKSCLGPVTFLLTLWNCYLLVSLQYLAHWVSLLLVSQTPLPCALEQLLLLLGLFLQWHTFFFFFKALGFRGLIGKEKVSVLAHLEFTLQLFVSFVDSNTGSEALFAFLLVFQESFWGAVFGILFCTPCSTTFPPLFSSKYVQFTRRC